MLLEGFAGVSRVFFSRKRAAFFFFFATENELQFLVLYDVSAAFKGCLLQLLSFIDRKTACVTLFRPDKQVRSGLDLTPNLTSSELPRPMPGPIALQVMVAERKSVKSARESNGSSCY